VRTRVAEIREMGRATQGVRLIELRDKDKIAAVAKVDSELHEDEHAPAAEGEAGTPGEGTEGEGGGEEGATGTDVADGGDE
jgi:DNA gyrase subunit A